MISLFPYTQAWTRDRAALHDPSLLADTVVIRYYKHFRNRLLFADVGYWSSLSASNVNPCGTPLIKEYVHYATDAFREYKGVVHMENTESHHYMFNTAA